MRENRLILLYQEVKFGPHDPEAIIIKKEYTNIKHKITRCFSESRLQNLLSNSAILREYMNAETPPYRRL